MRRAGVVLALIVVTVVAGGCASTGHTWQDEFTARLEGESESLEGALEETHPYMKIDRYFDIFLPLGRTLERKGRLVAELNPPVGCEEVQEAGDRQVSAFAGRSPQVPKNLTPLLERDLPQLLEEEIEALEQLEAEAETCASG